MTSIIIIAPFITCTEGAGGGLISNWYCKSTFWSHGLAIARTYIEGLRDGLYEGCHWIRTDSHVSHTHGHTYKPHPRYVINYNNIIAKNSSEEHRGTPCTCVTKLGTLSYIPLKSCTHWYNTLRLFQGTRSGNSWRFTLNQRAEEDDRRGRENGRGGRVGLYISIVPIKLDQGNKQTSIVQMSRGHP